MSQVVMAENGRGDQPGVIDLSSSTLERGVNHS